MPGQTLDREKLRAATRRLESGDIYYMLDQAIDLLPQAWLVGIENVAQSN